MNLKGFSKETGPGTDRNIESGRPFSKTRLALLVTLSVVAAVGAILYFAQSHVDASGEDQRSAESQPHSQTNGKGSGSLQVINNPGGGQIVYGPVSDQSTMQGAMVEMLRNIHGHFGEKPQVKNFFRAKGSDSVATFFSLNGKKQDGEAVPIYGMVIVSMTKGSKPLGAVLYDDAAHFSKSQPAMMATLNKAWNISATADDSPSQQAEPITLRQATGGDRSASIGLPPGWQLTNVSGGFLSAIGPEGEMVSIAGMFQQIHDPRMGMRYGGGYGQNGPMLVASLQDDLFTSYASLVNQSRRNKGMPAASFHYVSGQRVGPHAIQAVFEVDLHDGKGVRKGVVRLDPAYSPGLPTWALSFTATNAPETIYETQSQVMAAMYKTYSQNRGVIEGEQTTVLNNIAAAGARSRAEAADANERRENSTAAFNQHMNDISANSKAFQNYTLDRSQVSFQGDDGQQYHGTFENPTADALVAQDPTRFQIIQSQQFVPGADY